MFTPHETNVGEQIEKPVQSFIANHKVKRYISITVIDVPSTPPPVYLNDRVDERVYHRDIIKIQHTESIHSICWSRKACERKQCSYGLA